MQWVTEEEEGIPSLEQAKEARREWEVRQAFWRAHRSELLRDYPDQFVAVHDGRVIAHSPHLVDLERILNGQGLEIADVWTEFVDTGTRLLIL